MNLDEIRLSRKDALRRIRENNGGYSLAHYMLKPTPGQNDDFEHCIDEGMRMTSGWLEKDSTTFLNRGLPFFGERIPYTREYASFYSGSRIIMQHLDDLMENTTRDKEIILDIGCGNAIALEDICAYYGHQRQVELIGLSLHLPQYAPAFSPWGIHLYARGPSFEYPFGAFPGYSLILAEKVLCYYQNPLQFAIAGAKYLCEDGIFVIPLDDFAPGMLGTMEAPTDVRFEVNDDIVIVRRETSPTSCP